MNQNTNNSKNTILLIYIILLLLTPPVTVLVTLLIQCIRQKKRIKHSKEIRKLSLGNISYPIDIYELLELEESKTHYYVPFPQYNEKYIKFILSDFLGLECDKEYFFIDEKLQKCIYQMNKKCNPLYPKFIYRKLKEVNGYPDEVHFEKKLLYLKCTWYGINGVIHFNRYASNMVEIEFNLKNN